MSTIVEMLVNMDCPGCESKIRKTLQKLEGVDDVEVDMVTQKVTVMGLADQETILKAARKGGRRAELWPFPYNPEYHSFAQQYYPNTNGNYHTTDHYEHNQSQDIDEDDHTAYYDNYYNHVSDEELAPTSSSGFSYNYYKHGYQGSGYGFYQRPPYSTIVDEQASSLFSDDNANACSIM